MKKIMMLFIGLLWSLSGEAGVINQAIVHAQQSRETALQQQGNAVHHIAEQSLVASQSYHAEVEEVLDKTLPSLTAHQPSEKSAPQIILFVSLGMPTLLLQHYIREGHRYHIPLVIRGLLQNNMPLTLKRINALLTLPTGKTLTGGIVIDPVWFQRYNIQRVPTLIINACPGCEDNTYDRIAGNLSLKAMLARMDNAGEPSTHVIVKQLQHPTTKKPATGATA